jgi:hypothetical protein
VAAREGRDQAPRTHPLAPVGLSKSAAARSSFLTV